MSPPWGAAARFFVLWLAYPVLADESVSAPAREVAYFLIKSAVRNSCGNFEM